MQVPTILQSLIEPWLLFLADDPALLTLQGGMLFIGIFVIFLVFYVTRDILLRTHSFWYMFVSIVLTATLPIIGFFVYILIRPARTIKQREIEEMMIEALNLQKKSQNRSPSDKKSGIVPKKKKKSAIPEPDEDLTL